MTHDIKRNLSPTHWNTTGLSLLLSIGALPIACSADNHGPGDSQTGTSMGAPDTSTGSATTEPTSTGLTTDNTNSSEPGTGSTGLQVTSSTTDMGGDTSEETGPPRLEHPVCQALLDHLHECLPRMDSYATYNALYCDALIGYGARADGQACADALVANFACLSALPCNADVPQSCGAELASAMLECPTIFGSGDTDGGSTG